METKVCSKCRKEKPLSEFYFLNDKGRYHSKCKECESQRKKEYRKNNLEKEKERHKKYRQRPEVKKRRNEDKKKYRKTEKHKKHMKKYRKENKEKIKKWGKKWRDNNLEYFREYEKNRMANDLKYKLSCNVGRNIRGALKKNKAGRHWETLVGYSLQNLMDRLSINFQKGMSFENYGKWEIDHIKPKSLFHYTTPEEQAFKDCWSLANLQPLWAEDNNSKGSKW